MDYQIEEREINICERELTGDVGDDERDEEGVDEKQSESEGEFWIFEKFVDGSEWSVWVPFIFTGWLNFHGFFAGADLSVAGKEFSSALFGGWNWEVGNL